MRCDQCEFLSINGIGCHERGCPNAGARYDTDSETWVKQFECRECGSMIDQGENCNCFESTGEEEEPTRRQAKIQLFLSDARGVYIPRDFADSVRADRISGVSPEDLQVLQAGTDGETYWDVWADVCDHAVLTADDGTQYTIHQDGDCWLVEKGAEYDENSDFDLGFYMEEV